MGSGKEREYQEIAQERAIYELIDIEVFGTDSPFSKINGYSSAANVYNRYKQDKDFQRFFPLFYLNGVRKLAENGVVNPVEQGILDRFSDDYPGVEIVKTLSDAYDYIELRRGEEKADMVVSQSREIEQLIFGTRRE